MFMFMYMRNVTQQTKEEKKVADFALYMGMTKPFIYLPFTRTDLWSPVAYGVDTE